MDYVLLEIPAAYVKNLSYVYPVHVAQVCA